MNKKIHIDSLSKEQIEKKLKERNQSQWLPLYHVSPPFGLLNDPNGLSYINEQYNIFFQWYPGGPTHGLKHWFKLTSNDLVCYKIEGTAMKPSEVDKDGVFSGSHFEENGTDKILYTSTSEENEKIIQRQNIADLVNGKIVDRKLLIDNTNYISNEFRDPSWFRQDGHDYIIIGAKTKEQKPVIALYYYKEGEASFVGNISIDLGKEYDMVECPQIINIKDQYLLIMSPQGLESDGKNYCNTFNVLYTIFDRLDLKTLELKNASPFKEFDFGHDFYAPQIFKDNNSLIMLAWAGCGKSKYPEQYDGWMNLLSMPRTVKIDNNILLQEPDQSIRSLVNEYKKIDADSEHIVPSKSFTLKLEITNEFVLRFGDENDKIILMNKDGYLILDRSNQKHEIQSRHGDQRKVRLVEQQVEIFIDNSVIEIFVNGGKNTMTSRIFCESVNKMISSVDFEVAELDNYKLEYEVTNFE